MSKELKIPLVFQNLSKDPFNVFYVLYSKLLHLQPQGESLLDLRNIVLTWIPYLFGIILSSLIISRNFFKDTVSPAQNPLKLVWLDRSWLGHPSLQVF